MLVYKLTTQDNYTRKGRYNQTKWGRGVTHTAEGHRGMCSSGAIHAYTSPLLAVLLNPIHAAIQNPKLWEAEMEVLYADNGLKVGGKKMTTIAEIPVPEITIRQRTIFAILCAKAAFGSVDALPNAFFLRQDYKAVEAMKRRKEWEDWAEAYMEGKAEALAADAAYAAYKAVRAAAYSARTATYATYTAADAARAAAYTAYSADAAYVAYSAAYAARAARAAKPIPPLELDKLAALATT